MKVELTFTEPLLGTLAGNKELAEKFIANKHPQGHSAEDEMEAIENLDESLSKASTIFPRGDRNGRPFIWNYQVKGFFKSACEAMISTKTMTKEELKKFNLTNYLYKKTIDQLIFVNPRRIFLQMESNGELQFNERPLRGQTMRGERVALARSEMAPAGTKIEIEVICLNSKLNDFICRWLDYGALLGMGQWRTSGMGTFTWRKLDGEE